MSDPAATPLTPFERLGADRLADEVASLVSRGLLDSRSAAADALLDYREPPRTPRSDRLATLEAELSAAVELVLAAGCICANLASAEMDAHGGMEFRGEFDFHREQPLVRHDPRCPVALAEAIEARSK